MTILVTCVWYLLQRRWQRGVTWEPGLKGPVLLYFSGLIMQVKYGIVPKHSWKSYRWQVYGNLRRGPEPCAGTRLYCTHFCTKLGLLKFILQVFLEIVQVCQDLWLTEEFLFRSSSRARYDSNPGNSHCVLSVTGFCLRFQIPGSSVQHRLALSSPICKDAWPCGLPIIGYISGLRILFVRYGSARAKQVILRFPGSGHIRLA